MEKTTEQKKIELFSYTPVPIAVLKMSVPTVLASLVMVFYNLVDTYFVGMLNAPVQTAAVTLAAPVLLAFNAINNLFGVGGSSLMSRALGAKEYETVKKAASISFYAALICAVVFASACCLFHGGLLHILGTDAETRDATWKYLQWTAVCGAVPAILTVVMAYMVRAEGASLHASIGTMSGCLLNIVLDPFFILPKWFGLGAAGAGLATFLSNSVACLYFFVLLWCKRRQLLLTLHPKYALPDTTVLKQIFIVGVPASIQNLLNVTGMTVLNNFMSAYGADALAAMGIVQKLNNIPMYIVFGMSQGIMPLVGYNYADHNRRRMRQTVVFAAKISISFLLCMSVVYFVCAHHLVGLFMEDAQVVFYGTRLLRGMCLGLVFLATDFLAVGVFQSCGMGGKALLFAFLRKIVLEIPALIVLNKIWPLYGLAYAQLIAEFVLAVAAIVMLYRILKGEGNHDSI